MKKLLLICLISFLPFGAANSKELLSIVSTEEPPYQFTDKNGNITGIYAEILHEILKKYGFSNFVKISALK